MPIKTGLTVTRVAESGEGSSVVYTVTTVDDADPPVTKTWEVNESQFRTLSNGLGKAGKSDITTDGTGTVIGCGVSA